MGLRTNLIHEGTVTGWARILKRRTKRANGNSPRRLISLMDQRHAHDNDDMFVWKRSPDTDSRATDHSAGKEPDTYTAPNKRGCPKVGKMKVS